MTSQFRHHGCITSKKNRNKENLTIPKIMYSVDMPAAMRTQQPRWVKIFKVTAEVKRTVAGAQAHPDKIDGSEFVLTFSITVCYATPPPPLPPPLLTRTRADWDESFTHSCWKGDRTRPPNPIVTPHIRHTSIHWSKSCHQGRLGTFIFGIMNHSSIVFSLVAVA